MTDHTVRLERFFDAPPETVFQAWTQRASMEVWYRDGVDFVVTVVELDVRVGGRYRIEFGPRGEPPFVETGTYLEVEPSRRLVMTETLENVDLPWADTRVTVEFDAHDSGTRVVLTHEGFPSERHRAAASEGWPGFLDRLNRLVGQQPG